MQGQPAPRPDLRDDRRTRLLRIIKAQSLLTGAQFTLASGQRSGFFFDMKRRCFIPKAPP